MMKINRLTEKINDGDRTRYIARQDRVNGKIIGNGMCLDKLGSLEDLEEKGLLIKLPCKVGGDVYWIDPNKMTIRCEKNSITSILITEDKIYISTENLNNPNDGFEEINTDFAYLTKEAAEQALNEKIRQLESEVKE